MSQSRPYQPALLRILHTAVAILIVSALVSGFWVYNTYDKRWGSLALPKLYDIQGIHGTIALTFFILFPFFAFYSFHLGDRRLVQAQSFSQLKQVGKPVWWVSIHRFANTIMLLATTVSIVTGRMMQEKWLPSGELTQPWYLAHLLGWVCVLLSLALHVLMGVKVGGISLLISMFHWQVQDGDAPRTWWQGMKFKQLNWVLKMIEGIVVIGFLMALLLPILVNGTV
jgi:hypothetical protein